MSSQQAAASDPSRPPTPDQDSEAAGSSQVRARVWNRSVFLELCDLIGEGAAARIIGLFRVDLNARFVDVDSRDALRRDAHAIKSTAGMLGFDDLSASATTLEADCEGGHDLTRSLGELISARRRADEAAVAFGAVQRSGF